MENLAMKIDDPTAFGRDRAGKSINGKKISPDPTAKTDASQDKTRSPRLHNRRVDRKGRSTSRSADSRFQKLNAIETPFVPLPVRLLESPAFMSLSGNALKALFVMAAALGRAGPTENGALCVSYDGLQRAGIRRNGIRPALDELDQFGFVRRTVRGHRVWGRDGGMASAYRLTWRAAFVAGELLPPSNEWARFGAEISGQPAKRAGFEGEIEAREKEGRATEIYKQ